METPAGRVVLALRSDQHDPGFESRQGHRYLTGARP
eukprot:CAMPEP_0174375582 /NCGR_PEP_ID=MMETSP0811_2-20130205/115161_1 /TAXON_ID=73025 ORGANISM="Eutreptiella gymnastica-like, Strain CCMP1594" /NCGR_SAMPLE_ID=MMETSP0811_2 /ASSEMBLY_ACC=CAM_ASM_000667 /LENGTH=35 /DNA_ID= /DNA_START= /DNA_END= /DNA_ORIENTATION=